MTSEKIVLYDQNSDHSIIVHKQINYQYAFCRETARLETYINWNYPTQASTLACCGFFSIGFRDYVKCPYCLLQFNFGYASENKIITSHDLQCSFFQLVTKTDEISNSGDHDYISSEASNNVYYDDNDEEENGEHCVAQPSIIFNIPIDKTKFEDVIQKFKNKNCIQRGVILSRRAPSDVSIPIQQNDREEEDDEYDELQQLFRPTTSNAIFKTSTVDNLNNILSMPTRSTMPSPPPPLVELEKNEKDLFITIKQSSNYKPCIYRFASRQDRIKTLNCWPIIKQFNINELADSGLFYVPNINVLTCFYCAVPLYDWISGEDPWIKHIKKSNHCLYVKLRKGVQFVNDVLSFKITSTSNDQQHQQSSSSFIGNSTLLLSPNSSSSSSSLSSSSGGPSTSIQLQDNEFDVGLELHKKIDKIATTTTNIAVNMYSILNRNTTNDICGSCIKNDRMCKICFEQEYTTLFQPCRHILSCFPCSTALIKCPTCRQLIDSVERIFLP